MDRKHHTRIIASRFIQAMNIILELKLLDTVTKNDFAVKVGMTKQDITLVEKGDRYPTLDTVYYLCTIFSIDTNWIITGGGAPFCDAALTARVADLETRVTKIESDKKKK